MPGTIRGAVSNGTFPTSLSTKFVRAQSVQARVNEYHDGTTQRSALVDESRRTWQLAKRLTAATLATLRDFWQTNPNTAFTFYDPFETVPPFTQNPTTTDGAYLVRFNSDWNETIGMVRSDAGVELIEMTATPGAAPPPVATTVWTDWISAAVGADGGGTASGTLPGGITVSYSGELDAFTLDGSSNLWTPASSFIGGTVTASPGVPNDDLRLNGSSAGTNTITFSTPVTNPLFAIATLGDIFTPTSFTFTATPILEAGGPTTAYGGSSITVVGNVVSGQEGSGVVQFSGTFSSLSWTDTAENFYAFTVGMNA